MMKVWNSMKTVTMLKGLPASGKSTWAASTAQAHPGVYKVINKDSLRAMLDVGKHTDSNEGFVLKVRDALVVLALDEGKHVIIDDTNLNPLHERTLRELVRKYNAEHHASVEFRVVDFTHIGPEECKLRDRKRCPNVGDKVIQDMYNRWLRPAVPKLRVPDPTLPTAIIVDMDGTLAWRGDRDIYDGSKVYLDIVNPAVLQVMLQFNTTPLDFSILITTGRQEKDRVMTERWLEDNGVPYDKMFMRATDDQRQDAIAKQEIYETEIEGKYNVLFVLDDRQQVVDMWRRLGLQCFQVAEGAY